MSASLLTSGPSKNEVLKSLVEGILAFREALTGHAFYAYQQVFTHRIIEAIIKNEGSTITGLWSRQSGKTTGVAELGIALAILMPALAKMLSDNEEFAMLRPYVDGFRLGIFAPIREQAELSYGKMRDVAHSDRCREILEDEELRITITSSRGNSLTFSNGSLIHAKTASPDSKIEGFTYHAILIDEAQAVDRFKVEKEIEPMRASTNGVMVKIGTAWVSRGGFHSDIEYNVEQYRRGGARNHFEFPYDIVIREKRAVYEKDKNPFHLSYEKYVEGQRLKLGEDSLAFRMNFKLKWQDARLDAISARALLGSEDPAFTLNEIKPPPEGWTRVAGLDIAKANDSTVVTILDVDTANPIILPGEEEELYRKRIVGLLELQGDFESGAGGGQYQEIAQFLNAWRILTACIDATGMGDPVFERLKTIMPDIEWIDFKYTSPKKSDLFKHFLDEWEAGRIKVASGGTSKSLPTWIQFFEQHKNLEREYKNQYLDCHAPMPQGKAARVTTYDYHDDYPNSCALACWAAKEGEGLGTVQVDKYPITRNTSRRYPRLPRASRYGRR